MSEGGKESGRKLKSFCSMWEITRKITKEKGRGEGKTP